jgi:CO/xanthine dehydrogenase Mo-binding subunit
MDAQTGAMLNADMEFYKLAGIGDIGEIKVHMDIRPENDKRGVIGLGEPPAWRSVRRSATRSPMRSACGCHTSR